jgi:ADP-ribose pyrophosphatase
MASKKSPASSPYRPIPQKDKRLKVLTSEVVYEAPVFYVTSEQVKEPSGVKARRDLIRHPGSVVIMALDETKSEPRVLLIKQYRYAAGDEIWEFPAGRIDPGDTPLSGAKRELAEETGFKAREWKRALFFYSSPGFLDETMSVFLARDLIKGEATPEEDEFITAHFFPVSKAVRMVMDGEIQDAKTIAGILWIDQFMRPQRKAPR